MQSLAPAPRQDGRLRALDPLTPRPPLPRHPAARAERVDPSRRCRTVWISDVHLGTKGCKAELLVEFLRHVECDHLYLVGDIIDGWALRRGWFWHTSHDEVLREILAKRDAGARVTYVSGNHDEFLRRWTGIQVAGVEVVDEAIHETADGRRLLVLHGDQFDVTIRCAPWLVHLGDRAYVLMLAVNRWFNAARRLFGMRYWSLSAFLKERVKNAVAYVSSFEEAVVDAARARGADGVVAGHIHKAELRRIGDFEYANDGDWVESCTALVEGQDGALRIVRWAEERERVLSGGACSAEQVAAAS